MNRISVLYDFVLTMILSLRTKLLKFKREISDDDQYKTLDVLEQRGRCLLRWLWNFGTRLRFIETVVGRRNRENRHVSRAENVRTPEVDVKRLTESGQTGPVRA